MVGLKKPRYDIFGETVDITRQMEETGTGIVMSIIPVLRDKIDLPAKTLKATLVAFVRVLNLTT